MSPRHSDVQVFVGGKETVSMTVMLIAATWWWSLHQCTDIPVPFGLRAEVTADNTSIRVSWQWLRQGVCPCVLTLLEFTTNLREVLG